MAIGAELAGIAAQAAGLKAVFQTVVLLYPLLHVPFFTTVNDRAITAARPTSEVAS